MEKKWYVNPDHVMKMQEGISAFLKQYAPVKSEVDHGDSPSVACIGMFFYYLVEGKVIPRLERKDFIQNKIHRNNPYNFQRSDQNVYADYLRPKFKKNDLIKVIEMLKDFPAAQGCAKNDLYSVENDNCEERK